MNLGDLVKFVAKDYGPDIKDQWVGLIGMVTKVEKNGAFYSGPAAYTVLVNHPDDEAMSEVFAMDGDLELVAELTDKQLENVIGGQSRESFENWRAETVNQVRKPCES